MIQIQNSDYNQNPQKSQSHLSQSTQLILLLVAEPLHPKCCVLFNLFFMMLCRKNSIKSGSGSVPVHLNVYDLTSINGYAYWLGLGVYHSGVQVHGIEYAFGAHEYPTTGIFEGEPKQCDGFTFRKAILIGWTEMGLAEGMFCNCIIPVSLNSTKVRHHRIEDKVCEGDKKKLRSGSKRFASSSNSSSSSSSSPPKATRSSSRKKHSVLPSSPLIVGPPSS
ncbi:hypothetical protein HYC85_027758 [Camellia sinensis]|uniref:PPPDE domain-containing protein n=1 Tax=Camellia sinensis TaxID=4442 RepID=A0A7J7FU01_CAMSI|nr:hypothetical protein HYC85_027758 [Camellia sinensis]